MAKSLETIQTELLHRVMTVERAAVNVEARTVQLAFSSEMPVKRWFGQEILDHSPDSVDLSRMNDGGALLVGHNPDDQVGVVESAWISKDKKARAVVRFGRSQRANEIFQDVNDGIRKLVSVGYSVNRMVREEVEGDDETMRVTSWTPMEISFVATPADPSVGVGRSNAKEFSTTVERETKAQIMETANPNAPVPEPSPSLVARQSEIESNAKALERTRVADIQAVAARVKHAIPTIDDLANRAIRSDTSLQQFQRMVIDLMPAAQPVAQPKPIDIDQKEWSRYSITRAIRIMSENRPLDGFEKEMSDEVTLRNGRSPTGFWLPAEALVQRNFLAGTNTLGGFLVQTNNLGDQLIELLRNRAKVVMLGARTLVLNNPVSIPRQIAAGSVNWVTETAAATLATGNFDQASLTPKGVTAFQQYSKQLLFENNPSIDALVRDDIANIIALEIDRVALHGTGSSQPTGITGTTGVTTIALGANGSAFTVANGRASMISLESALASSNADVGSLAYLTNAKMRGRLKAIDQSAATNTARWVWEQMSPASATVNGYRAEVSNQVSSAQTQGTATTICSSVFFGNWTEVLIGSFNGGATDLVVDPYTLAVNGVVRLIARHWTDVAIRHGASFSVLLGVLDS